MDGQLFRLVNEGVRRLACGAIMLAPDGWVVKLSPRNRSLEQSARFWAIATEISENLTHGGVMRSKEAWASIFLGSFLHEEIETVPGISPETGREDLNVQIILGRGSSQLTVKEMMDVQTLMEVYCANRGFILSEGARQGLARLEPRPRPSSAKETR